LRLHGTGKFHKLGSERFNELTTQFDDHPGIRGIVEVCVSRIGDSCGWSIPKFEFVEERETLTNWVSKKADKELADYRTQKNSESIDGLPGF